MTIASQLATVSLVATKGSKMNRPNDSLVTACSAFNGWADLIHSIEANNYVPTIYPDNARNLKLRAALTEAGHRVHPPQDALFARVGYRSPEYAGSETCYDCSLEAAQRAQWSSKEAVPALGDKVNVLANEAGEGTVIGHRIEHDWAGLWVELDKPCDAPRTGWHGESVVFVFGCDLEG